MLQYMMQSIPGRMSTLLDCLVHYQFIQYSPRALPIRQAWPQVCQPPLSNSRSCSTCSLGNRYSCGVPYPGSCARVVKHLLNMYTFIFLIKRLACFWQGLNCAKSPKHLIQHPPTYVTPAETNTSSMTYYFAKQSLEFVVDIKLHCRTFGGHLCGTSIVKHWYRGLLQYTHHVRTST